MRIRKEIASWNGKRFIRIALVLFVLLNAVIVLLQLLTGRPLFDSYNWVLGVMQPVLLASIFTYSSREATLFINDYQNIESFQDKLNKSITEKGMARQSSTGSLAYFAPARGFQAFQQLGGHRNRVRAYGRRSGR